MPVENVEIAKQVISIINYYLKFIINVMKELTVGSGDFDSKVIKLMINGYSISLRNKKYFLKL